MYCFCQHIPHPATDFLWQKAGWNGIKELHEYNVGTTCGDWYSGTPDEAGLPTSTMRDGTAKGYSFISFTDNQYKVKYRTAGNRKTIRSNYMFRK